MSLLHAFERYPLTFGPTPIEPLPRLSEALGGKVDIYAKREDCNSGLAMGGNKLRKLEYIVPDIIRLGGQYAGLHRRCAIQPHAYGGGDGSQDWYEMRRDPGKMGASP